MSMLDNVEWVRRVRWRPGDVIVVKSDKLLHKEQVANIQEQVKAAFPDVPVQVMVVPRGFDLAVIGPEDDEDEA